MFYKKIYEVEADKRININDETSSFVKLSFASGSLSGGSATITGIVDLEDGTTVETTLCAIGEGDLSVVTEIDSDSQIYMVDTSGYSGIKSSVGCTVILYSVRY